MVALLCMFLLGCGAEGQGSSRLASALASTVGLGTALAADRAAQDASSAPLGQSGGWQLVFSDEFEGDVLDSSRWVTCYWWDDGGCTNAGNEELQWYRPENVSVADGKLSLSARRERARSPDGQTFDYTSGLVSTGRDVYDPSAAEPRATFRHVYVEMKAKVPAGRGLWPALWLLPADHESKPEIDVMEILGHDLAEVHMNFHYLDRDGDYQRAAHSWTSPEPLSGWHVYAVDWQPRGLTWYVDGAKRAHFTGDDAFVPDEPMYLIANLAVGGDWPGAPDRTTPFPSALEIDYLRVWIRN